MSISTPAWIDSLPDAEQTSARRTFFLRLAALYATPDGTLRALSIAIGRNPNYLSAICQSERKPAPGLLTDVKDVIAVENLVGRRIINREMLRPDLFVVAE